MFVFSTAFLSLVAVASAQSCQNYGTQNGSACACPPGFGGANCSQPACGGDIFQGSHRSLVPPPSTPSSFPNITAAGCSCETGWSGTDCNVCQSASACQNAYTAVSGNSSSGGSVTSTGQVTQNDTLVCNSRSQVYAAGHMSCQVINPTIQHVFPLPITLNILRTLQPTLTPIPNATAFGTAGSVFAQLWYAGIEQFYCQADSCKQTLDGEAPDWDCQNLQCTCIPGTTFCDGPGSSLNLATTINTLSGEIGVSCSPVDNSTNTASCDFKQSVLQSLFGSSGLSLNACSFGECVRQSVIDTSISGGSAVTGGHAKQLSSGVIAGLAVVGALLLSALVLLVIGLLNQRKSRKGRLGYAQMEKSGGVGVEWADLSYVVPGDKSRKLFGTKRGGGYSDDKVVLDNLSGSVQAGQMMAILGPSGAGKTTLVEILAGRNKSGRVSGAVSFPSTAADGPKHPRIGFVPQQDILPPMLTVVEALLFAARLRLPETISEDEKRKRVNEVMEKLGIETLKDARIGWNTDGKRGISGGEMRRVSIGLELVARPDVLILDEPTSGLDSVSAAKVANVLRAVAHDPVNPTAVIASIHQPSSQLYQTFDSILLLSHGHTLYYGPGSFAPAEHFARSPVPVPQYQQGYNIADYLLEVASDPPVGLFSTKGVVTVVSSSGGQAAMNDKEGADLAEVVDNGSEKQGLKFGVENGRISKLTYAATFLTQLQVLSGREWKILKRDKTLFFTHIGVSVLLGIFCGGLYFKTGITIAGFQNRVGCLFFLGALIAFSSLSALYNIVEIRPLFLRERSSAYYSPTAWLLSRFTFDVVPLRIIPTIIVSTITYWMTGLAADAAHFFKFLFILVLYTLAMTLFNFLLGTLFRNGGVAILLSALSALYQMTFAGFFVHLTSIPPVLRWLQWICPLKYTLEALSVNEVGSGLMIEDTLQGVPVNVSASLIMQLLFGFGINNYYRDVLVLFGFIAAFGLGVIGVVWLKVRERR